MTRLAEWLPPLMVGGLFTLFGLLKVYGFARGIQGGGCKPWAQRACGSCPSWSREINIAATVLLWTIGLVNLAWFWLAWRA